MRNRRLTWVFFIAVLAAIVVNFIQLPYYITKPGLAEELSPIIKVDGGDTDDKGSFSLTTVRMGQANPYSYAFAKVSKYQELFPIGQIRQDGESDEEFNYRQLHMMEGSKETAILVAYKKAGEKIEIKNHGVYVIHVLPDMPAAKSLKAGDRIFKLNGHEFDTSEKFIEYVSGLKKGDSVAIEFERDKKVQKAEIKVAPFPKEPKKIGIGISLVTDQELKAKPDIVMDTEEIGGPSAGLMFTLEIYNQLKEEDLSKGYKVGGTGTISPDGTVGPIGGISQKIVAADKAGIEIFFAPNEKGARDSNYREAMAAGKDIGTKMKIVPVDTFEDALKFLESLPEKNGGNSRKEGKSPSFSLFKAVFGKSETGVMHIGLCHHQCG